MAFVAHSVEEIIQKIGNQIQEENSDNIKLVFELDHSGDITVNTWIEAKDDFGIFSISFMLVKKGLSVKWQGKITTTNSYGLTYTFTQEIKETQKEEKWFVTVDFSKRRTEQQVYTTIAELMTFIRIENNQNATFPKDLLKHLHNDLFCS